MLWNSRGIALVSVLLITAVMLIISSLLAQKVIQTTRVSAQQGLKKKSHYAANSGVEEARRQLALNYDSTSLWGNVLSVSTAGAYPLAPTFTTTVDNFAVRIFVRDNNDGDGDYTHDNDLRVFVLAEAQGPDNTRTMVETLGFLKPGGSTGGYNGQYGQGAGKTNRTSGGLADALAASATGYDISDAQ
ncbi:PilX N-terminal domain-containing pilus assembly protein [Geopsychrobacter electrodiphilus]|uniref:PilX N-terminal domain-containing pilus assembly protein n=1 Tax=Geopsychrobacter electrodiphilus TaxID=225196 RepID=UPI0003762A16|nr:PilX N-terminal domain-containing pilus assembly protein [Geopsychrobacter electrodiphilus]